MIVFMLKKVFYISFILKYGENKEECGKNVIQAKQFLAIASIIFAFFKCA